jgi:hypothetical protein
VRLPRGRPICLSRSASARPRPDRYPAQAREVPPNSAEAAAASWLGQAVAVAVAGRTGKADVRGFCRALFRTRTGDPLLTIQVQAV